MIDYIHGDLFLSDATITNILIYDEETGTTFGNDKIYFEELQVNESISLLQDLTYGSCNSCYVSLKVRSDVGNLKGKKITISLVLDDNTDEPFILGTYKVQKDNLQANEGSRVIEAFDALYDVINTDIADWYNTLYENDEAYSIAQLRHSLLEQFEIVEEETTLINDNVLCEKTIKPFSLSGYDVLSSICELNGVFAHIGRDNVLRYIRLDDADTYTITTDKYVSMDYESYSTAKIDGVQIRAEENDIGGAYPPNIETANGLIIEDNFLCYGKSTAELNQIASNIYNTIKDVAYVPIELLAKGNPCLEVGDAIKVQTTDGQYITTYVLEREIKGIQTMADDIYAQGNEERDDNINSVQSKFMQLKGQTATLTHTVDGLTSTVETIEGNYASKSELEQTSDSLTAQIETLQQQIDGDIHIYYRDGEPTLLNYPAWDFTYNIPCNNTVQLRDDLPFEYTEEYYKRNLRSIVYDETNNIAYRFVKYNGEFMWQQIADTETALILQKIAQLEITTEGITATVAEIEQGYVDHTELQSSIDQSATQIQSTVSATYETKSNATSTKNALQSQITQNAGQIALKVSQGRVSSELSLETGQVTISGNRLVVDSDNFKLSANGNVTATGTFTTTNNDGWYTKAEVNGYHLYNNNQIVGWFGYDSVERNGISYKGSNVMGRDFFAMRDGANNFMYLMGSSTSTFGYNHTFNGTVYFADAVDILDLNVGYGSGRVHVYGNNNSFVVDGSAFIRDDLTVLGQKNRAVHTEHYGMRCLNAYETAYATFGDNGSCEIETDNQCTVMFDEIWMETVDLDKPYQVLLTATSEKNNAWVEKKKDCFIVHGENGATFDWMIIARQKDYADIRLQEFKID